MAIHVSGDSVEFLEGELVAVDGDVFFRIPITHFSLADPTRIFGVIGSSLSVAPERVSVGQTHEALATIRLSTEPIEVFLSFRSEDGDFRRFRFSAPQAPLVWGSARIQEWKPSPPVSKIGEASDESGDAGDVRYDIRNLNHEEQDGSHSLSLQLGGGLVVGDGDNCDCPRRRGCFRMGDRRIRQHSLRIRCTTHAEAQCVR